MSPLKIGFFSAVTIAFAIVHPAVAEESITYENLLTPVLKTGTDIIDQPIAYPPGTPEITSVIVTIPPGGETDWHIHEVPLYVYILDGEVTVDYGEKGIKVYKSGEAIMEAMQWAHNGMNKGAEPVRIMAVYIGSDEKANAAAAPAPK